MAKLNSNRLANLLNTVYSLSRKNKNKTILYWIFLDENRIFDYKKFINSIPPNRNIGVVYRSKEIKKKYNYIKELLRICRKKKFTFLISSNYDIARALGADGIHYPNGFKNSRFDNRLLITCSYHGHKDFRRARALCSDLIFLSPIYNTKSKKNKKGLGLLRISLLANYIKCQYSVMGGIGLKNIKSLRNRGINSISGLELMRETIKLKC